MKDRRYAASGMTQKNGMTITSSHIWFVDARSIADANAGRRIQRARRPRETDEASPSSSVATRGVRRTRSALAAKRTTKSANVDIQRTESVRRPKKGSKRKG